MIPFIKGLKESSLRIRFSPQNMLFRWPKPLLFRFKPLYCRVQGFLELYASILFESMLVGTIFRLSITIHQHNPLFWLMPAWHSGNTINERCWTTKGLGGAFKYFYVHPYLGKIIYISWLIFLSINWQRNSRLKPQNMNPRPKKRQIRILSIQKSPSSESFRRGFVWLCLNTRWTPYQL